MQESDLYSPLKCYLEDQGYDIAKIPCIIQYNKRDLPNVSPLPLLKEYFNERNQPDFEAVATTGFGVFNTLKAVAKLVLTELKRGK